MPSPSDGHRDSQIRTYSRASSIVFCKTNEKFGGLSNMAGGFPLGVNGVRILTSEALYQACRFPHMPEIQRLIIAQASPMTAKMKSKPYRRDSRPDWNRVRVKIMRWCLRVKLTQNWSKFQELLLATGDFPIVEQSRNDDFWGAKIIDDQTLMGMNVLGRLLMELREEVKMEATGTPPSVVPLLIPDFLLDGRPIQPVLPAGDNEGKKNLFSTDVTSQAALFERPSQVARRVPMKIQLPGEDSEIEPAPAAGEGHKPEPELDRLLHKSAKSGSH